MIILFPYTITWPEYKAIRDGHASRLATKGLIPGTRKFDEVLARKMRRVPKVYYD